MIDSLDNTYQSTCNLIISECRYSLASIDPASVGELIDCLTKARKVFFIGVGRVMLSLEATAKRFSHCGIDTVCVGQINEPAITPDDILIVGSGSGESLIPLAIAKKAKQLNVKVVLIGSNPHSSISKIADLFVRIPVRTKLNLDDEIKSDQIMTSLFEQTLLLFGDAVAKIMVDQRQIDIDSLWNYHANLE